MEQISFYRDSDMIIFDLFCKNNVFKHRIEHDNIFIFVENIFIYAQKQFMFLSRTSFSCLESGTLTRINLFYPWNNFYVLVCSCRRWFVLICVGTCLFSTLSNLFMCEYIFIQFVD